jgi:hypothetical protein
MNAIEPGSNYLWRPKIVIEDFQDPFYGPKSWLNSFRIRIFVDSAIAQFQAGTELR